MRTGVHEQTGQVLEGWPHCVQSIRRILMTAIGERLWRREFGSMVPTLQDRSANARTIMAIYAAVADALRKWEPGFRLRSLRMTRSGADGVFIFELRGDYFPRGHLGDYSVRESADAQIGVRA